MTSSMSSSGSRTLVRLDRGGGSQCEAGTRAEPAQLAGQPVRGTDRLGVEGDAAGAGLGVGRRPPVRVLDHQVTVERLVRRSGQRLHNGHADSQVGHEVVVHHVDVQPVGTPHRRRSPPKVGVVGSEHARRDLDGHGVGV
jgi:hypothetical protein